MSRERFVELLSEAVVAVPQDLKSLLRLVEDQDFDDESRTVMAGALLHIISSGTAIPGVRGVLRHLGDVLVIRIVLQRVAERSPEAFARHREDSPEFLAPLEDQLAASREYLGERMKVLEQVADGLAKLQHQGHAAAQCVQDRESADWLYDAVHEALLDQLDIDDDEVAREMKGVDRVLAPLQARLGR